MLQIGCEISAICCRSYELIRRGSANALVLLAISAADVSTTAHDNVLRLIEFPLVDNEGVNGDEE